MRVLVMPVVALALGEFVGIAEAQIDSAGAKLSPDEAGELFAKICVLNDARTAKPKAAATKLGFKKEDATKLHSDSLNADVSVVDVNGAGLCALVFLPAGSDESFGRFLGQIKGMKKTSGNASYLYNGNGQRSASFARIGDGYPDKARVYMMMVGKNAEAYDK